MSGSFSTVALLTGITAAVVALVTLGLARAARRAGLPPALAPSVAAGMIVWLGASAALARSGPSATGRPSLRDGPSCR